MGEVFLPHHVVLQCTGNCRLEQNCGSVNRVCYFRWTTICAVWFRIQLIFLHSVFLELQIANALDFLVYISTIILKSYLEYIAHYINHKFFACISSIIFTCFI
jgi:hypothetical protein